MKEILTWAPLISAGIAFLALVNPWMIKFYEARKSQNPSPSKDDRAKVVRFIVYLMVVISVGFNVREIVNLLNHPTDRPNWDAFHVALDLGIIFLNVVIMGAMYVLTSLLRIISAHAAITEGQLERAARTSPMEREKIPNKNRKRH